MPRKILIGSTNPSKIEWLKEYLTEIPDIECVTLSDLGVTIDADEEGNTPEENALLKATAYHNATGLAVVAHDSGLYFQEFPLNHPLQPGLHIRRIGGKTLDDDGMMAYYSRLASNYGPLHACYLSGFAAVDENGYAETFAQDQLDNDAYFSTFGFLMCSIPHAKRHPGWPLDSLSKDLHTGEYWFDRPDDSAPASESSFSKKYRYNVNLFYQNFFKSK